MLPAEACLFLFSPTISTELKINALLPKNVVALLERQSKEFLTSSLRLLITGLRFFLFDTFLHYLITFLSNVLVHYTQEATVKPRNTECVQADTSLQTEWGTYQLKEVKGNSPRK